MRDASRIAYAQARIQARYGERPGEALWRELEAGRDLPHLIERLRASSLRDAAESLAGSSDPHALESRLRSRWQRSCRETGRWYPADWQPAFAWLGWLPALPLLEALARESSAPAWLEEDPELSALAGRSGEERAEYLATGPLAPLASAWRADTPLAEAWQQRWRSTWPRTRAPERQGLRALESCLRGFLPGPGPLSFHEQLAQAQAAATRVFRRQAGRPTAGLALLVLAWLDQLRMRAALTVAAAFGPGRPP